MNRRDFIKGALMTTVAMSSGASIAGAYEQKGGGKLNRLSNRENPSVLEKKHVPLIETAGTAEPGKWFEVKVKVGFMTDHPSTPGHWITEIKLLVDKQEVAKTEFEKGGVSAPCATFNIKVDKTSTLEAIENCNLHGTWISDAVTVKVA